MQLNNFQSDLDAIARIGSIPRLLDVVCRTTGLGFAAIARVTEDRWITCQVLDSLDFGLGIGDELEVDTTICHEIRQSLEPVVINCVAESDAYCSHHTPQKYGFESYISVPIVLEDGSFFGTLCALDPKPAKLENPETIGMFTLFAELIATQLDTIFRADSTEHQLAEEHKLSELREQFIAVLGHDLRNPIASVASGTNILLREELNEKSQQVVQLMQGSVRRMIGLVDDLMDLARGLSGIGITIERKPAALRPFLEQVVDELRSTHPTSNIEFHYECSDPVNCDQLKIAQLLSNLLGNALTHGNSDQPIRIRVDGTGGNFGLAVRNSGEAIDPETMKNLFKPFFRSRINPAKEGLGLGLYIASEIAKAHNGTLKATSNDETTEFRFEME
ncbi:MAG: GAF domain-containing sensor histidine kinase [Parasphingorhabdus sp.]